MVRPWGGLHPPTPAAPIEDNIVRFIAMTACLSVPSVVRCPPARQFRLTAGYRYGDLRTASAPIQRIRPADTHADYLSTIDAIAVDPDFMLLHLRPRLIFLAAQRYASVRINAVRGAALSSCVIRLGVRLPTVQPYATAITDLNA
jgi:hypothetical protein